MSTITANWTPTRDEVDAIVREMRPIIDRCAVRDGLLLLSLEQAFGRQVGTGS